MDRKTRGSVNRSQTNRQHMSNNNNLVELNYFPFVSSRDTLLELCFAITARIYKYQSIKMKYVCKCKIVKGQYLDDKTALK
jgi:hypothetical protein